MKESYIQVTTTRFGELLDLEEQKTLDLERVVDMLAGMPFEDMLMEVCDMQEQFKGTNAEYKTLRREIYRRFARKLIEPELTLKQKEEGETENGISGVDVSSTRRGTRKK